MIARAQQWLMDGLFVLICIVYYAAVVGAIAGFIYLYEANKARAQQHHHLHHSDYQGWINKKGEGCCNNQDCGELADKDERTSEGGLEVRVEGQWCPVLPHHYLMRGNVPNASTSHVCVWHPAARPDLPHPCQRLLCYQPRPLS